MSTILHRLKFCLFRWMKECVFITSHLEVWPGFCLHMSIFAIKLLNCILLFRCIKHYICSYACFGRTVVKTRWNEVVVGSWDPIAPTHCDSCDSCDSRGSENPLAELKFGSAIDSFSRLETKSGRPSVSWGLVLVFGYLRTVVEQRQSEKKLEKFFFSFFLSSDCPFVFLGPHNVKPSHMWHDTKDQNRIGIDK